MKIAHGPLKEKFLPKDKDDSILQRNSFPRILGQIQQNCNLTFRGKTFLDREQNFFGHEKCTLRNKITEKRFLAAAVTAVPA